MSGAPLPAAMRVLHLDSGREMRGGQVQALRLIEGLEARGAACTLLARAGSPLYIEAVRRGWRVGRLGALRAAIECRRADIVHAHDARCHTLAALAGGAPLVASRRVAFPVRSPWKYRRAARVIAVSRHVAGLLEAAGIPRERIAVVYDGVPSLAPPDDTAPRSGVLAPANAADAAKGARLAGEACALAGVELAFSDNLERDLPHAAVFLYVTYSEGLGSAALLAMGAGAAVVASRVGGLPEAVADGVTGLLAENTPQAMARAVARLLDEPETARTLALQARREVAERFSPDRMVEDTMAVYKEVLG